MMIDLQLNPALTPWPTYITQARAAEEGGYATLWVFDHLSGSHLRGTTMLECFALLGALSTATRTIGLGSMVVNAATRPAGLLAASIGSVQQMSGGRFILGIGAGAAPGTRWSAEFDALNMPLATTMADRHQHLLTVLTTVRHVWAAHQGPLASIPRPIPHPPVIVGLNSPALARLAAHHADGVNVLLGNPRHEELIEAARAERPSSLPPLIVTVTGSYTPDIADGLHPDRVTAKRLRADRLIVCPIEPIDGLPVPLV